MVTEWSGFRVKVERKYKNGKPSARIPEEEALPQTFMEKFLTPLLIRVTGHSTEQMFLNCIDPVNHACFISPGNFLRKIHAEEA